MRRGTLREKGKRSREQLTALFRDTPVCNSSICLWSILWGQKPNLLEVTGGYNLNDIDLLRARTSESDYSASHWQEKDQSIDHNFDESTDK